MQADFGDLQDGKFDLNQLVIKMNSQQNESNSNSQFFDSKRNMKDILDEDNI